MSGRRSMKEYNEARSRRGLLFWQDSLAPARCPGKTDSNVTSIQIPNFSVAPHQNRFERVVAEASEILLCVVLESARLKRS
jgi:hypothetical protein